MGHFDCTQNSPKISTNTYRMKPILFLSNSMGDTIQFEYKFGKMAADLSIFLSHMEYGRKIRDSNDNYNDS